MKKILFTLFGVLFTMVFSPLVSLAQVVDTVPPSTPTLLYGYGISSSQVSLYWATSTDNVGVAGYEVFRGGVQVASTTLSNYVDFNLQPSTTYSYYVIAFDAAGNMSAPSAMATATTYSLADTQAPTAPTNLVGSAVTFSQVNLSWAASYDNVSVSGYNVYRNGTKIGVTPLTSYSDTGLISGTTYTYTASAYDGSGNLSTQSSPITVSVPSSIIGMGDRIQTTANLNVRTKPTTSPSSKILGVQYAGSFGTVVGGPTVANGYTWWNVNFDSGADGWVVGNYLAKVFALGSTSAIADATTPAGSLALIASLELQLQNALSQIAALKSQLQASVGAVR